MTTYYVDSAIGDDSLPGTTGQPFETLGYAVTQMGPADTLVIRYASGTAYPVTSQITIGAGLAGTTFVAEDGAGVRWDVSPETYNRDQLPLIDVRIGAGDCFVQTDTALVSIYGLDFDGTGFSAEFYSSTTSGTEVWIEGCRFRNSVTRALRIRKGTVRECWVSANAEGILIGTRGLVSIESTVIYGNTGLGVDNWFDANVTLRNVTLVNNGTGTYPISNPAVAAFQNVLIVDSSTTYGLPAGEQTTGNVYTSDAASYHTSGNYNGAPTADDLELSPSFLDAASQDFHLQNDYLATAGTANSVPRLYDGTPMPGTPPIGALGIIGIEIVGATVDSGTQITVTFADPLDPATVEDIAAWTVEPVTAGVAVAVRAAVWVPATNQVVLTLYPTLSAGVNYLVTALAPGYIFLTNEAGTPLTNEHLIPIRQG
jgi:hypothetical protein